MDINSCYKLSELFELTINLFDKYISSNYYEYNFSSHFDNTGNLIKIDLAGSLIVCKNRQDSTLFPSHIFHLKLAIISYLERGFIKNALIEYVKLLKILDKKSEAGKINSFYRKSVLSKDSIYSYPKPIRYSNDLHDVYISQMMGLLHFLKSKNL